MSTDDWLSSYVERLEHFSLANKVEAEQKKDTFLACITFGLLRALVAPQKLKDRTYEQLVAALTTHVYAS